MISSSYKSLLTTIVIFAVRSAASQPTPAVPQPGPIPVITSNFIRVTAPRITFTIDGPPVSYEIGKHAMLIQENEEFFITMCSNAFGGVFLSAFPINTRNGRTAWTTPEQKVFFAVRTTSCRGLLHLRAGDELPIESETRNEYKLRLERFGHSFPFYLSRTNSGFDYVTAPTSSPRKTTGVATARQAQRPSGPGITSSNQPASFTSYTLQSPPSKRFIITPVGPATGQVGLAMSSIRQSSAASKTKMDSEGGFFSRLLSLGKKTDEKETAKTDATDKGQSPKPEPKPAVTASAEQEPEAQAVTTQSTESASTMAAGSAPGTPAGRSKASLKKAGAALPSTFGKYQIPIIVPILLMLIIIGLYSKSRQKARQREEATNKQAPGGLVGEDGSGAPPPLPGSSNDFSGSIASMSMGSVTQFLNSDKETGTLHVKDKDNNSLGTLVFIKGEIIDAKSPNKRGIDALYQVLKNKEGFFSFIREEPKDAEKTITQGTISLLLDAHRIMDEEQVSPPPAVPPTPSRTPTLKPSAIRPVHHAQAAAKPAAHAGEKPAARKLKLHGNR